MAYPLHPPRSARFPAAAHLVCDEDQQLTAEALEAVRIAVNKRPGRVEQRWNNARDLYSYGRGYYWTNWWNSWLLMVINGDQ